MISDIPRRLLDELQQSFSATEGVPGQQQLKQALQAALAKLDLVTRDEFDAQRAVLLRTREKLEALEAQLAELEKRLEV